MISSILAILATLLPMVAAAWMEARKERKRAANAITQRDIDELDDGMAAVDRMQSGDKSVSP